MTRLVCQGLNKTVIGSQLEPATGAKAEADLHQMWGIQRTAIYHLECLKN